MGIERSTGAKHSVYGAPAGSYTAEDNKSITRDMQRACNAQPDEKRPAEAKHPVYGATNYTREDNDAITKEMQRTARRNAARAAQIS